MRYQSTGFTGNLKENVDIDIRKLVLQDSLRGDWGKSEKAKRGRSRSSVLLAFSSQWAGGVHPRVAFFSNSWSSVPPEVCVSSYDLLVFQVAVSDSCLGFGCLRTGRIFKKKKMWFLGHIQKSDSVLSVTARVLYSLCCIFLSPVLTHRATIS